MDKNFVIRAWRDEDFLLGLDTRQRNALPANPAGLIEMGEADLLGGDPQGCTCQQFCTFVCSDASSQRCCS